MKDELLGMFRHAVENNLWDMYRGLYPEVIRNYAHDQDVMRYTEETTKLMNIRMKNLRGEYRGE